MEGKSILSLKVSIFICTLTHLFYFWDLFFILVFYYLKCISLRISIQFLLLFLYTSSFCSTDLTMHHCFSVGFYLFIDFCWFSLYNQGNLSKGGKGGRIANGGKSPMTKEPPPLELKIESGIYSYPSFTYLIHQISKDLFTCFSLLEKKNYILVAITMLARSLLSILNCFIQS
jgi:hypothetical protein